MSRTCSTCLTKTKKNIWSDDEVSFFEPCAGHGNIVMSIYKRRLEGFYKKARTKGSREAAYYAVANALNTMWAIDIDQQNIDNCRSRVLSTTLDFLKSKLEVSSDNQLFASNKDFHAHVMAAIKWHIDVNETLSSLSDANSAKKNADLTRSGSKWYSKNGHHQIDFNMTWVRFFIDCDNTNSVPLEYERALRFVEAVIAGKRRGFDDYDFAKSVIDIRNTQQTGTPTIDSISVGA